MAMVPRSRKTLGRKLNRRFATAGLSATVVLLAAWSPLSPAKADQLDGRQYSAGIVRKDADDDGPKQPMEDTLTFRAGKFSSAICKRFNFADAPYWIRAEDGQIHFLAELTSPTDGTMVWKGTVRGDTLEGTMRWTKKRWYWTIDTEHRIRGTLEKGRNPGLPAPK